MQLYQENPGGTAGGTGESQGAGPELTLEEGYQEAALNCFRYLGFTSFDQVDRLTIPEYNLLMEAVRLREVDKDYRNHLQAYLNFAARAMKKAGKNRQKPVYSTFKRFYDYDKELGKIRNRGKGHDRFAGLKAYLREGGEKRGGKL